jgi:SAM-dependent methyltransferase
MNSTNEFLDNKPERPGLVQSVAHRALRVLRTGLRATIERQISRATWNRFERRLALETDGNLNEQELGVNNRGFGYQPIDYLTLRQAFKQLPANATDGAFVDFGCGKGRALLFAAMQGFTSVYGVEFNTDLVETSRVNLERLGPHRHCQEHEVVHSDATEFSVPDDATVLFFYNPFGGEILRKTLENIQHSIQRNPREVVIIYALPKFDVDLMAKTPWLAKLEEIRTCNSDWERLTIYRSVPQQVATTQLVTQSATQVSAGNSNCESPQPDSTQTVRGENIEGDPIHAH